MIITDIFEDFPKISVDLYQQTKSGSKKSSSFGLVKSGIKVFIQPNKGDLVGGLMAGFYDDAWIDVVEIEGITLNLKDQLRTGNIIYEIVSATCLQASDEFEPFWKLTLERRTN